MYGLCISGKNIPKLMQESEVETFENSENKLFGLE